MDQGQGINKEPETPSLLTRKPTRNDKYEQRQDERGLTKLIKWVPKEIKSDMEIIADRCCEDRDLYPATLRSKSTGKIVGI